MPYELVHQEGEELPVANSFAYGDPEKRSEDDWIGDAGYSDAFHTLKKQMDFTRAQYKDQLKDLPERKKKLSKELMKKWFQVFLFLIIIPVGLWILTDILMELSLKLDAFSVAYLVMKILLFPAIFVSVFFFLPPAIRSLVNCQWRYSVFNNPTAHARYREKYDIVSFAEEEHFLRTRLGKFEQFDERVKLEQLDQVGGGEEFILLDDMSEKQKETLSEMQELAVFKDYQARVGTNRVEGDARWILLGFVIGIFIAFGAFATVM